MTGKSHLVAAASEVVIVDAGFKLISDFLRKPELFSSYRAYVIPDLDKTFGIITTIICVFLLFVGSLAPDIDSENSMLGRFVHLPIKHRTFTHSVFFILPFVFGGVFWRPLLWLSFGIFTHLFCDSFSKSGLCWFWPLSGYRRYGNGAFIKKGRFVSLYETGAFSEYFWVVIGLIAALVLIAKVYLGLF